jgi:hypothetical protein
MSLMVLVLVLSFPAVGLLLYILTVAEIWLLSDPVARKPRQRARRAEDQAPERQAVILPLAQRPRQRAASSAPQAGQEGEATSSHPSGRAGSGAG